MRALASAEPGWEWWEERLDIGEWKNRTPGSREVMATCPVHGGGSLHVSEAGARALLKCFGCDATYAEIKEAVESAVDEAPTPIVHPGSTLALRSQQRAPVATSAAVDPMAWTADRCGTDVATLEALGLPLEVVGKRIAFTFGAGIAKLRGPGDGGKRKDIVWVGDHTPPLWPMPTQPEREVVICEGEFDAIVLRVAGYDAYSITGGAGNVPEVAAFRSMRAMGVERVHVLFDEDGAGRKGAESILDAIREADIETVPSRVAGIDPLLGEKDARDVALRVGAANVKIEDAITDDVVAIDDVDNVPPAALMYDYLHPSEHTILYGDGGTGKGVIAAWWAALLIRDGHTVLVVDYEAHARHEWRPRLEAFLTKMGIAGRMKTHAFICQPTQPIWEIGDWLRDMARRVKADYVIVDSVTYACVGEEAEKSTTAIKYSGAIARLGFPVLSIAHVTKADANPKHPFGSVYWSNGARSTVAVSRVGEAAEPRLLKNQKSNQRALARDQHVDWSWVDQQDGPPEELVFGPAVEPLIKTVEALMMSGVTSPKAVVDALVADQYPGADLGQPFYERVRKITQRQAKRGVGMVALKSRRGAASGADDGS